MNTDNVVRVIAGIALLLLFGWLVFDEIPYWVSNSIEAGRVAANQNPPLNNPAPPPSGGIVGGGGRLINNANAVPGVPPTGPAVPRCKPGFEFKGGMCVGAHVAVDPDGPDPYRRVVDCKPGDAPKIKVPLPDGHPGYRLVDQVCRVHPREASAN